MKLFALLLLCSSWAQISEPKFKWGTYKPQLIHAVTERNLQSCNPFSLVFYYFLNEELNWEKSIKYKVSEKTHEIYDYVAHDAETFAIHDTIDDVMMRNEFYKIEQSGDWVSSVTNTNAMNGDSEYVSVVYSFALEKLNSNTDLRRLSIVEDGVSMRVILDDLSSQTTYMYITLLVDGEIVPLPHNNQFGFSMIYQNPQFNWNCRHLLYSELKKSQAQGTQSIDYQLPYNLSTQEQGNLLFIQYVGRKDENFHLQIRYASQELKDPKYSYYFDTSTLRRLYLQTFNEKFLQTFTKLKQDPTMEVVLNSFHLECAKSSFSNLMGGYGVAYGDLHCEGFEKQCSDFKMILSMTPSREGFPRPFLWDEGFHNMLACRWNPSLCLQSLSDWFDTMTDDGWIPREQARVLNQIYIYDRVMNLDRTSRATSTDSNSNNSDKRTILQHSCSIFSTQIIVQINDHKLDMADANTETQIRTLWPKLKLWYTFWLKSQGVEDSTLFKWWGPHENINFGSGMDDWPRSIQGYIGKYNVDASAWAWYFADSMERLSKVYEPSLHIQFKVEADRIKKAMNEHLLDASDHIYKDLLVTQRRVKIPTTQYSPHIGYPNLLPFAFGMIDESNTEVLNAYLNLLKSDMLWSKYGIRSLSKFDEYFGKGDNYWRGPIWIPINYLILRALYKYYRNNPDAMVIYQELRKNIMDLVCTNWRDSGVFYEHYNQRQDGKGRGHHPFNGCTSLITLIIGEQYD